MVDNRVANPNMHYQTSGKIVTVISPPDKLATVKPSDLLPKEKYKDLAGDKITLSHKKQTEGRKFPMVLKIIGGITLLTIAIKNRNSIITYLKKLLPSSHRA